MAIILFLFLGVGAGVASYLVNVDDSLQGAILRYLLLITNGVTLLVSGLLHLFKPEFMARELGWEVGGSFQKVVGFWNLGAAVICGLAFFSGEEARVLPAVLTSIFWAGAASLHWRSFASGERTRERALTAGGESLLSLALIALALSSSRT